jgi:hypothetical protein
LEGGEELEDLDAIGRGGGKGGLGEGKTIQLFQGFL